MLQLWVEVSLFVFGWVISYFSAATNSLAVMEIGSLALGLAGTLRGMRIMIRPEKHWATCGILAAAGMATYCLGNFLTLIQYDGIDSVQFSLLTGPNFIAKAFVATTYLSVFYWMLALLAGIENKSWRHTFEQLWLPAAGRRDGFLDLVLVIFLLAVGVGQTILMLTGVWSYQGLDTSENKLPVAAAIVWALSEPIPAIAGWIIGRSRRYPKTLLLAVVFAGMVQVPWLGALGRRPIAFGFITFLVFFFWARGSAAGWKRLFYMAMWAVPAAAVIYVAAELFLTVRYAILPHSGEKSAADLSYLLSNSFDIVMNDRKFVHVLEGNNYSSRFFIFQYLTIVIDQLTWSSALHGMLTAVSFLGNIPRALYPNKPQIFLENAWIADGKGHLDAAVGLPVTDSNFSPFVQGYGDFMWGGAIIYPLVFFALGWALSRIVRDLRSPMLLVAGLGICLMHYIAVENTLGAFIATLRPLALIWLFATFAPQRKKAGVSGTINDRSTEESLIVARPLRVPSI